MSNQKTNDFLNEGSQNTILVMEAAAALLGIYIHPASIAPYTRTMRDITVPAVIFMFVATSFLLSINYLPLFDAPSKATSITETIKGTSIYLQTHALNSLFAQSWSIISFFTLGWFAIIFVMHHRDRDAEIYMLGATLLMFSIVLIYIILRHVVGLFFIKAVQVWEWPEIFLVNTIKNTPATRVLLMVATGIPLLSLLYKVYRLFSAKGLITLALFFSLIFMTYQAFNRYVQPGIKGRMAQLQKERDSILRKEALQQHPSSQKDSSAIKIQTTRLLGISGLKDSTNPIEFRTYFRTDYYVVYATFSIRNVTDRNIKIPLNQAMNINLIADSIALQKQKLDHGTDFQFDFANLSTETSVISVPGNDSKVIKVKARVSHLTYDYLLRYMRDHADAAYFASIRFFAEDQGKAVEVKSRHHMWFNFVNSESFGNSGLPKHQLFRELSIQ